MIRNLLAGASVLALLSGAALAQDSVTQSTTTTVTAPDAPAPVDSVSKSTTVKSSDSFGNQHEESDSVSKSQAMTPNGTETNETRTHSSTDQ
jgi:hypothetical protein